jgi:hypothetical protein
MILEPQSAQFLDLSQTVPNKPLAGQFYIDNPKYADAVMEVIADMAVERMVQE